MTASFSNLSLAEPLARAVAEMGYESMTPIQAQAIPVVLTGKDVMGAAQTGTGKTAAFSLPLLQRLLKHENTSTSPARHPVRALVLLPTRELADQVAQRYRAAIEASGQAPTAAVLVRRNADAAPIAEALTARGIPVEVVGLAGLLGVDAAVLRADVLPRFRTLVADGWFV